MQIEELIIKEAYCANECSAATAVVVLTQDHRDQCCPSANPATKPWQDRWRYCVVGTVVQIKCFFSGWWKAHTHSASCWVAAETPSLMYQPHRAQRERGWATLGQTCLSLYNWYHYSRLHLFCRLMQRRKCSAATAGVTLYISFAVHHSILSPSSTSGPPTRVHCHVHAVLSVRSLLTSEPRGFFSKQETEAHQMAREIK